jgi:hypothetical protein
LKDAHFADRSFSYLTGLPATVLGVLLVAALCALLYRAGSYDGGETLFRRTTP